VVSFCACILSACDYSCEAKPAWSRFPLPPTTSCASQREDQCSLTKKTNDALAKTGPRMTILADAMPTGRYGDTTRLEGVKSAVKEPRMSSRFAVEVRTLRELHAPIDNTIIHRRSPLLYLLAATPARHIVARYNPGSLHRSTDPPQSVVGGFREALIKLIVI